MTVFKLSNLTTFLHDVEQELLMRGHNVVEGFPVAPDLQSVANAIESFIHAAYTRGCADGLMARGSKTTGGSNAYLAQIVALSDALHGLIQSRCAVISSEGHVSSQEFHALRRAANVLQRVSDELHAAENNQNTNESSSVR